MTTRHKSALLGVLFIVSSMLIPGTMGNQYWTYNFSLATLYVIVAIMQNTLMAEAGQMSFGQGAVFGLSAVVTAVALTMHGQPFWLSAIYGVLGGTALGILFAAPALRVQGYYLGFVTLSAALVLPQLLIALDDATGGVNGVPAFVEGINNPIYGTITPLSLLIMGFALLALLFSTVLPKTMLGRKMVIVSQSTEGAQSLGIHPGVIRSIAFIITAFGTAIAGALYVPLINFVGPTAFGVDISIFFFLAVIVGGQGRVLGPIIGVWILYLVPNVLLAGFADYRLLAYGVVALVVMLAFPDGVIGSISKFLDTRKQNASKASLTLKDVISPDEIQRSPDVSDDAESLIIVDSARKSYGAVKALDGASLTIRKGTIHGLVGPNGCGKTTMLNAISGFVKIDSGTVELKGTNVTGYAPYQRARLGLGRTFQKPRIYSRMSIWDNIRIGAKDQRDVKAVNPKWEQQKPDLLPHGQLRLLEILRVMESGSQMVLLDEPAGGLSSEERVDLAKILVRFRDNLGMTILIVEHDLSMVWSIADDITVMAAGTIAAAGNPDDIRSDPAVRKLFTGGSHA